MTTIPIRAQDEVTDRVEYLELIVLFFVYTNSDKGEHLDPLSHESFIPKPIAQGILKKLKDDEDIANKRDSERWQLTLKGRQRLKDRGKELLWFINEIDG